MEKKVGETPLQALERLRAEANIPNHVPLAYAGRLDPMASGKLLVLIGDECKKQHAYHAFDKEYRVEVLLGAHSDTGDVLGLIEGVASPLVEKENARTALSSLLGDITLSYPAFSSKTVHGKPLHVWTLEGRLDEIDLPSYTATIYRLTLEDIRTIPRAELHEAVTRKIATLKTVTDERKALGRDFRRTDVLASWEKFVQHAPTHVEVLTMVCTASAGTYMRTLADEVGKKLGTRGLALSIHRTKIGRFLPLPFGCGFWIKTY